MNVVTTLAVGVLSAVADSIGTIDDGDANVCSVLFTIGVTERLISSGSGGLTTNGVTAAAAAAAAAGCGGDGTIGVAADACALSNNARYSLWLSK